MARPAHPGQFIRMEIIEPLGLSVTKAAEVLGVTRPALSALLDCRKGLVNLFARMRSPQQERKVLTACFPQAAWARAVLPRQSWNRALSSCW